MQESDSAEQGLGGQKPRQTNAKLSNSNPKFIYVLAHDSVNKELIVLKKKNIVIMIF